VAVHYDLIRAENQEGRRTLGVSWYDRDKSTAMPPEKHCHFISRSRSSAVRVDQQYDFLARLQVPMPRPEKCAGDNVAENIN
jgi:hypothetical protein